MNLARVVIALCFVVILAVPFALRPRRERARDDAQTLIVVTPHVQQIRAEYGAAFSRWHEKKFGTPVNVDWRQPGGTSEILKQLESAYQAAIKNGQYELRGDPAKPEVAMAPGTIGFDVLFGGGTYDHGRVKAGVRAMIDGREVSVPMSVPAGFSQQQLDAWFGENRVGAQPIYDKDQYWIGVALSGFGIVYNRDVMHRLGLGEPRTFEDLTDPRLAGWVALADPRQSGSVATAMDSILNNYGWERGWKVLRETCANTRYFTDSSTKPPIDVSAGEAAAGLAIDFYGRGQSQAVMRPGETPETSRVGYVDPAGSVYIDADPVSILRGAPHPDLAEQFLEFCLSDEGQALWQFRSRAEGAENPVGEDGEPMGPVQYDLRRAPARREMYEKYMQYFVDKSDPFKIASDVSPKGWRGAIGVMMGAFAIDIADSQRPAWRVLNRARQDPAFPTAKLTEMETLFYAWPETVMPDGQRLAFSEANCKAILAAWKAPGVMPETRIEYTKFFQRNYDRVCELGGR